MKTTKIIVNTETIAQLASQGKRLDMRGLLEYRQPINVELGISWTAEGSAKVQVGETVVIAGVKMAIEKPYNDTPEEGGIMVNVELVPLSSPDYETGPPGIKAVELARVVDRGIREAKALDMKKLCITPGEKAWFVTVDVITLNDAGNLFDVAGMAVYAALRAARFPEVNPATWAIDYKKKTDKPLPLVKEPLPVTVYKINGALLVDPSSEEENAYDARLTVASDTKGIISAMQKGGPEPFTSEEISKIIDIAIDKSRFLRTEINKFLK